MRDFVQRNDRINTAVESENQVEGRNPVIEVLKSDRTSSKRKSSKKTRNKT